MGVRTLFRYYRFDNVQTVNVSTDIIKKNRGQDVAFSMAVSDGRECQNRLFVFQVVLFNFIIL